MATEKKRHKDKSERGFTQENGPSRKSIKKDPFVYTDSGNYSGEDNLTIEQFYGQADEGIACQEVASKKYKKLKHVEIEYALELAKEDVQEKNDTKRNDQPKKKKQKHHKHKNGIDLVTVENQDVQRVDESVSSGHKKKKKDKIEHDNHKVKKTKQNEYGKGEERLLCSAVPEDETEQEKIQAGNKALKKRVRTVEADNENQKVKERKKQKGPEELEKIHYDSIPEEENGEMEETHNKKKKAKEDSIDQMEAENLNVKKKKKKKKKTRNDTEELEEIYQISSSSVPEEEQEEAQARDKKRKKKKTKLDEGECENQIVKKKKRNDPEELEKIEIEALQYSVAEEEQEETLAKNSRRKRKKSSVDKVECVNQMVKKKRRNEELQATKVDTLQCSVTEEEQEEPETKHSRRKKKKKSKADETDDENQKVKEMKRRSDPEGSGEILPNPVPEEQEDKQEVQARNNRMEYKKKHLVDKTEDENRKVKKRKKQISPEVTQQDTAADGKTGGCERTINIQSSDDGLSTSGEEDSAEYKRLLCSLINKQRKILNCVSEEINHLDREVEAGPSIIDEINRNIQKHAKVSRKFIEDYELEKVTRNRRKLRTTVDPSEELPRKLDENALSRDQARTLAKLSIIVPWQPAPLHLIETAITRSPKLEQLKQISLQKLEVKKNAFSAEEDEILMNNWRNFCRLHDLDEDPSVFLKLKHLDVKNLRPKHRLNFVRSLARNLDNRLLVSVYNRFKTICNNEKLNTGRFTKAEDSMILDYVQSSCGQLKISQLALILNRDFRAIRKRANVLTKPRNPLVFTDCELKKFVRELMKATETGDVQDLKNKEFNSACWHEVSSNLNIPVKNLKKTWKLVAYPRLFSYGTSDSKDLKENLIKRIRDSAAKDYEDINWEQLASGVDGFTPELLHKMFKEILDYYVPPPFKESLTKALIYLQNSVVTKHKFRTGRRFKPLHV